jgi:hypothetical protein
MAEADEPLVIDNLGDEFEEEIPFDYSITSYGADPTVDGLVQRMRKEDILIPPFQRGYVWNYRQACRFIESLLLGLPVPGIFFSKEDETERLLVIDGQQRLRTLQYFYDGVFEPTKKVFELRGVHSKFVGLAYKTLPNEIRRKLDNAILHATIVRQDKPSDENSSVYLIFERLNTGGTELQPQEIRAAIYHGEFNELLKNLNKVPAWREIFGPVSSKTRDQELILRFLGLYFWTDRYESPMKRFLNTYMSANRHLKLSSAEELRSTFANTIELAFRSLGKGAFRPERALNAAVFDAVMVGLARRLQSGEITNHAEIVGKYATLIQLDKFKENTERATARKDKVRARIELATAAFASVP